MINSYEARHYYFRRKLYALLRLIKIIMPSSDNKDTRDNYLVTQLPSEENICFSQ